VAFARVQNAAGGTDDVSLTVTLPAPPSAGNLLIAVANADATVTIGGSGWNAGPSIIDGNGAYLWWKIAGSGEPSAVTFTPSVSDYITAGLLEYSGNSATPYDTSSSSTHSGSATNTTQAASMTTTTGHDLGIAAGLLHQNRGTPTVAPTSPVWSGSATWSSVQSGGAVSGSNVTVWDFVADNLDLGPTGAVSASVAWSTVSWPDAQQLLIAFKPGATTTYPVAVFATVSTAGVTGRRVSRLCASQLTTAAVVRRRVGHILRKILTTGATVTVTSHGPLRNAIVTIGAAVDRWIIGPIQDRWKIGPGQ